MNFRIDKGTGYMYCYNPNHPCANSAGKVMEHVYVVWLHTGKIPNNEECIHHKDRNKVNNNIDNLVLMDRREHSRLHQMEDRGAIRFSDIECGNCGEVFRTQVHDSVFCSKKCANLYYRKFEISKEELQELVWKMPTVKIAEIYGVSDTAVAKRCKLYGITKPSRGYWAKLKSNKSM